MKTLTIKNRKIFAKLIKLLDNEQHLKLDSNRGFMPLYIELLRHNIVMGSLIGNIYSLSHYYKQNGDLIPDPDMTFFVFDSPKPHGLGFINVLPLTFQNSWKYNETIFLDDSNTWKIQKKLQADITSFANIWLKNINYQQL